MKKRGLFVIPIIFLIFILSFVLSQTETGLEDEQEKVNNAYECLDERVEGECSSLSTEEKIFSLLAIGECRTELIDGSEDDGQCWPESDCEIKTTAQAVLALDSVNVNTDEAENWLLSQNRTSPGIDWYLEIESPKQTTCLVSYSESSYSINIGEDAGSSHSINIGEDKKIDNNAGSCLTLAQDDYWLRVSPVCYGIEFQISCDEGFLTTLLFRKTIASTINVLKETSSAAAEGTTTEKVESYCLTDSAGYCDYEGNLWAALVLDSLEQDVSSFLPYLITMADENERYLPEAFLYFLTADTGYRTDLLSKQKNSKWWMEFRDKFYDTALALYPFQSETFLEKTNSKIWLLGVQDDEGCWDSRNIRNTAFILASIWPRPSGGGGGGGTDLFDCENSGYFCVPEAICDGNILSEYDCPSLLKCCNLPSQQETCAEMNGEVCSSNEACKGGYTLGAPDLSYGEKCCFDGYCESSGGTTESECIENQGVCRNNCDSNEEAASYSCEFSGETCCILKTEAKSYLWIWVLLILIILVTIGIIFRDRLRHLWFKLSSKFGKSKPGKSFGRPRPGPTPPLMHRPAPRRILPPVARRPARRPKANKELDDVLKKLKEMGK